MSHGQASPDESPLDRAAAIVPGGRGAIAKALRVTVAAVGNWKLRGAVPPEHCVAIERLTGGAVTRWDLRPQDGLQIWPELAANEPQREVANG